MKKLLSLLLVAILAIGALSLAACFPGNTPETPATEPSIEDAKEFLLSILEDEATVTPSDYTLPAQVIVGDYTYTVTWTTDREDITVTVDGATAKIDLNEKTPEAIEYTLTATISYGDLEPATVSRKCSIPAYLVVSFEDYMAANQGDVLTVEGIVVAMNGKSVGNSRNHLFLADASGKGGYYCYQLDDDPVAAGVKVGMTVSVTATVEPYSGMQELKGGTFQIVSSEITPAAVKDITADFAAGNSLKNYVGLAVTIKGVEIGAQDLGGSHDYLYFKLNGKDAYVRSYLTDLPTSLQIVVDEKGTAVSSPDKTAIEALHAQNFGNTADVTGILILYSGNPYLIPMSTDCFSNIVTVTKTDEEKVDAELDAIDLEGSLSSDTVIDVALVGKYYPEVAITWASDNAAIVYADGKLTVTIPEEDVTVNITATVTLGEVTKTKTIAVKLSKAVISIKDANAIATGLGNNYSTEKYLVAGVITKIANDTFGNLYITDENGDTLYVYGLYIDGKKYGEATGTKPVVGDYIVVRTVLGCYKDAPQAKNADLVSMVAVTTVKDAIALGVAKEHNTYTEEKYLITGVVESVANTTYGNLYIKDAEGNKLYIYGLYNQAGARYDALAVKPAVGDTITVLSVVGCYKEAAQLKNATLVAHTVAVVEDEPCTEHVDEDNNNVCDKCEAEITTGGDTTEHTHADANGDYKCDVAGCTELVLPAEGTTLTIAQALALGKLFAHDEYTGVYTEVKYYVTGKISDVYGTTYGNMKLVDENNTEFTVYGLYSADGATRYDAMTVKPVKGDTITVYGVIGAYQQTAQMNNGWLQSHTAHTHNYADATCTLPKKCAVCDGFDGEALGHNYEAGVCTRCNEAEPSDDQAPKSYVLSVVSNGVTYYASGITSSKTLSITTNKAEALVLHFEATATPEVYNIYYLEGTAKKYLAMSSNSTKVMTTVTDPTADGASWKFDTTKQQIVNTTYSTRALALYNDSDVRTYAISQTYTWVWYSEL